MPAKHGRLGETGRISFCLLAFELEVRAKVAADLGWRPVPELIEEIHDGDPSVRGGWPGEWWAWSLSTRGRRTGRRDMLRFSSKEIKFLNRVKGCQARGV